MLEEFRQQADEGSLFEEEPIMPAEEVTPARRDGRFLGMTAVQRLIIAILLLVITCLLSTFCLLVTERVVPPPLF